MNVGEIVVVVGGGRTGQLQYGRGVLVPKSGSCWQFKRLQDFSTEEGNNDYLG